MKVPEEMYRLIAAKLSGDITAEQSAELEKWLSASPENNAHFHQLEKMWQLNLQARENIPLPSVNAEWQRLASRLGFDESGNILDMPQKRVNWRHYAAAAAVLLATFGTSLWLTRAPGGEMLLAETGMAETRVINLADGSTVHLNHQSQLTFSQSEDDSLRRVELDGEAYFIVEKGERPFVVSTENGRIRVLGTQFNVWGRDEQTRVAVQEGVVSVTNRSVANPQTVKVTPNQLAVVSGSEQPDVTPIEDAGHYIGWTQGRIIFNSIRLDEVIRELEMTYDRRIRLADQRLGAKSLTANFEKKPIENILDAICLALSLNYRIEEDVIVIY
jgi:transmembrane sensor